MRPFPIPNSWVPLPGDGKEPTPAARDTMISAVGGGVSRQFFWVRIEDGFPVGLGHWPAKEFDPNKEVKPSFIHREYLSVVENYWGTEVANILVARYDKTSLCLWNGEDAGYTVEVPLLKRAGFGDAIYAAEKQMVDEALEKVASTLKRKLMVWPLCSENGKPPSLAADLNREQGRVKAVWHCLCGG